MQIDMNSVIQYYAVFCVYVNLFHLNTQ